MNYTIKALCLVVISMTVLLISCAGTNETIFSPPTLSAPEVNGYYLKSRITTYGDGRIKKRTYSLDLSNRRIVSDQLGDYYEFDEHGRINKFYYGETKSREYLRDRDWNVVKTIGIVSGRPNIDTVFEYKKSKLIKATDLYTSGFRAILHYKYDANNRLASRTKTRQGVNYICVYRYKQLEGSNNREIGFECGTQGANDIVEESLIVRRRHLDENGNIIEYFLDDNEVKFRNTESAKLNVFKISYEYEKTEFLVPNVTLFNWLLSPTL